MKVEIQKVKEINEVEKILEVEDMLFVSFYVPNSYLILLDGKKVGLCEFYKLGENIVDIHYTLFSCYRNQHLAYPIWKEVREIYGQMFPNVERLYALVDPNNEKSLHVFSHDMEFDYSFYQNIIKEGSSLYYPYFYKNPYYAKVTLPKQLTYGKNSVTINV